MRYLGLRAIMVAILSVPFLGPSGAIIYHAVVDGSLAKKQTPSPIQLAPVTNRSIDAY